MSGTELAKAWVSIEPSARGITGKLEKELKPLGDAADEAGDKAGKGFGAKFEQAAGVSLDKFGKTALIGAAALGVGLFGAAKAAGNLSAAISANEQVLGSASTAVQKWAKGSVDAVGLSERAALEASTSFGQLAKVAGLTGNDIGGFSIKMVTLAADMAALANVPIDQALADLQGAFAGQTEVVRKYNVFLDEASLKSALFDATGERVTGTLTAQQRVLATDAALWAATADARGQAGRESGSLARAQDNMKASLENAAASVGRTVVPAMTTLFDGVTKVANGFARVDDATGGMAGKFAVVGTVGLGAAGVFATVASKVGSAVDVFRRLGPAMKGAGAIAGAAGLLYLAYTGLKRGATEATEDFTAALQAEREGQKDAIATAIAARISTEGFAKAQQGAKVSTEDVARFIRGEAVPAIEELIEVGKPRGNWIVGAKDVDSLHDLAGKLGVTSEEAREFRDTLVDSRTGLANATAAEERNAAALGLLTDASSTASAHTHGLGDAFTLAGLRAAAAEGAAGGLAPGLDDAAAAAVAAAVETPKASDQITDLRSAFEKATDKASAFTAPLDEVFG